MLLGVLRPLTGMSISCPVAPAAGRVHRPPPVHSEIENLFTNRVNVSEDKRKVIIRGIGERQRAVVVARADMSHARV